MDADNDERAIVPYVLTRHIFSPKWTGVRLRRRWFKAPAKLRYLKPRPKPKRTLRPYTHWTDTDDQTIRRYLPAVAAKRLGRSLNSIYKRRSRITAGKADVDRKPRKVLRREDFE